MAAPGKKSPVAARNGKAKTGLRPGQKAGESATSPRRVAGTIKQAEAVRLRITGMSYAAIAEQTGYSSADTAREAIESALRKTIQPPAEEMRTLELLRLDDQLAKVSAMQDAVHEAAITGIPIIVRTALEELDPETGEMKPSGEFTEEVVGYRPNLEAIETYLKTINTFIQLSRRRADLTGLDAPTRIVWDDVRTEAAKVREQLVAAGIAGDNTELMDIINLAERIAMGEE